MWWFLELSPLHSVPSWTCWSYPQEAFRRWIRFSWVCSLRLPERSVWPDGHRFKFCGASSIYRIPIEVWQLLLVLRQVLSLIYLGHFLTTQRCFHILLLKPFGNLCDLSVRRCRLCPYTIPRNRQCVILVILARWMLEFLVFFEVILSMFAVAAAVP